MPPPVYPDASVMEYAPFDSYVLIGSKNKALRVFTSEEVPNTLAVPVSMALGYGSVVSARSMGKAMPALVRKRIDQFFHFDGTPEDQPDQLPVPLFLLPPLKMDTAARVVGDQGPVELLFKVNAAGDTKKIVGFGKKLPWVRHLNTVKADLKFQPAIKNGQPIASELKLVILPKLTAKDVNTIEHLPTPTLASAAERDIDQRLLSYFDQWGNLTFAVLPTVEDAETAMVVLLSCISQKMIPPTGSGDMERHLTLSWKVGERIPTVVEERSWTRRARVVKMAPYSYPATLSGVSGRVLLKVTIDSSGQFVRAEVVSATDDAFVAPAMKAVQGAVYEPRFEDGKAVQGTLVVPFNFTSK